MKILILLFEFLSLSAKPAKRQAASQSAPAAVAQPVIAPVAQNGNYY